ncbi:hypothetical protein FH609_023720 [Streptomyces sp. 3MP-14]|uniref:Uncharacterized protein n=1 Tax=Streptomyces mimosae TaxID=2586635 RepID=A0A5N6AFN1_9ACTN|nr:MULTISPECIES: DUF4175 domain-containing protein [Streptomyces]KAB8166368.1 hypothetical protein FH607_011080 [Streptomyces mimosae]KAB8174161.1 hypothetical protein FH609_023720 [Streptomyces sp. 3MP-14]
MKDQEFIAHFDGSPEVTVWARLRIGPLMAIAHEFGYELASYRPGLRGAPSSFTFTRDDSELARRRAAWAHYHYRINGAWWATTTPGPSLTAISPMRAGEARFGLFLYELWPPRRYLVRIAAVAGAASVLGVVLLFVAWPGALACLAVVLLCVGLLIWGPGWRARKEAEYRRTLEDFERQRVYWSYQQHGDAADSG